MDLHYTFVPFWSRPERTVRGSDHADGDPGDEHEATRGPGYRVTCTHGYVLTRAEIDAALRRKEPSPMIAIETTPRENEAERLRRMLAATVLERDRARREAAAAEASLRDARSALGTAVHERLAAEDRAVIARAELDARTRARDEAWKEVEGARCARSNLAEILGVEAGPDHWRRILAAVVALRARAEGTDADVEAAAGDSLDAIAKAEGVHLGYQEDGILRKQIVAARRARNYSTIAELRRKLAEAEAALKAIRIAAGGAS